MVMNISSLRRSSIPRSTGVTAVVEWFGWSHTGDQYQWVPAFDLDVPELLAAFHTRYPEKPGSEWEHI
jgi:hypothetical protein